MMRQHLSWHSTDPTLPATAWADGVWTSGWQLPCGEEQQILTSDPSARQNTLPHSSKLHSPRFFNFSISIGCLDCDSSDLCQKVQPLTIAYVPTAGRGWYMTVRNGNYFPNQFRRATGRAPATEHWINWPRSARAPKGSAASARPLG